MTITEPFLTFQSGDDLNEDNLRKLTRVFVQDDPDGFITRGLNVEANHSTRNISVGDGVAIIVDDPGDGAYTAGTPGKTDASFANPSGMNYVFVTIDPMNGDDVSIDIETTDEPRRTPALKIAEVDSLNDQPAKMFNEARDADFGALTAETGDFGDLAENGTDVSLVGHDHASDDLGASSPVKSVDTNQLSVKSAAVQASLDGFVVPVGEGLGLSDAIDPSSTATPIQDAIDTVAAQSHQGKVLLPLGAVTETQTINPADGVSVIGHGLGSNPEGNSVINFPDGLTALFEFTGGGRGALFDGFLVEGNGMAGTTPIDVFKYSSVVARTNFGQIAVKSLSGQVVACNGAGPYAAHLGDNWYIQGVDAGNQTALFDLRDSGPQLSMGIVDAYPKDNASGSRSNIIQTGNTSVTIGHLNVGGKPDRMINDGGGNGTKILHSYNFEPSWESNNYDAMLLRTNWWVGPGSLNGASFNPSGGSATGSDYFTVLRDADNVTISKPEVSNGYSLSSTYYTLATAPQDYCHLFGVNTSAVDNNAGSSTGYIRTLATAGTGTG